LISLFNSHNALSNCLSTKKKNLTIPYFARSKIAIHSKKSRNKNSVLFPQLKYLQKKKKWLETRKKRRLCSIGGTP
jgi:hypothetical protein